MRVMGLLCIAYLLVLNSAAALPQRSLQFGAAPAPKARSYKPLQDADGNSFQCSFDAYESNAFKLVKTNEASLANCLAACDRTDGCTGFEYKALRRLPAPMPCALWFNDACNGTASSGLKAACMVNGSMPETFVRCDEDSCSRPAVTMEGSSRQLLEYKCDQVSALSLHADVPCG